MKHRMIFEYLKTIIFAVLASVFISLLVCYFVFFAGKGVDVDKPQYLIHGIKQYIELSEDGGIDVDERALESLERYQSWMQIINEEGKVVYSKYVPEGIPTEYSHFDLVNNVLESDRIQGYTFFINELLDEKEYSVIIGCDSDVISKYSFQVEGGGNSLLLKCMLVFLVTSVCIVILAAYIFAKKVTIPIMNIIEDIEDISKGKYIQEGNADNLFHNVFSQLQNLQKALEENETTRAIWISNISHDIKTPLSTIKGYAELMTSSEYEFERDEIITYAKEILKSEEVIEGLVDDLKVSQMLVEGKIKLNKAQTNLYQLIQECIEVSKPSMKSGDSIDITCDKEIFVFVDSKLVKRSFINIICNAFIHNDQSVGVRIMVEELDELTSIVIMDNGKGMNPNQLKHIFERYYRGTNSSLTKGTGLGLAIAKEAILAHDGTIAVNNCEPNGTKFVITFKKTMSL